MEFRSRAVRSLVELHEAELRAFLAVWERFVASGAPMPNANGDPDYESPERLATHVVVAARSYMMWIREQLGTPVTDLTLVRDAAEVAPRLRAHVEETLEGWRRHLADVVDTDLSPAVYTSRWGEPFLIEQMLEHAVVHPMRHRLQLERALSATARGNAT
jgi:uncharacterized damage-inducible protein DinB